MTEREITTRILAMLRRRGVWVVKIGAGPYQQAGLPDILACAHGHLLALEVKRPGRIPTPLQSATLAAIRRAGGEAHVVTSAAAVAEILDRLDVADTHVRLSSPESAGRD